MADALTKGFGTAKGFVVRFFSLALLIVFAWTGSLSWAAPSAPGRGCCAKHARKEARAPRFERLCCCDHACKHMSHGRCACKVAPSSSKPTDRRRAVVPSSNALRSWHLIAVLPLPIPFIAAIPARDHVPKRSTAPPVGGFLSESPRLLC